MSKGKKQRARKKASLLLVVPVFNEEQVLPMLFNRMEQLASTMEFAFPIVVSFLLIDDGLPDATPVLLAEKARRASMMRTFLFLGGAQLPRYLLRGSMNVSEEKREKQ